MRHGIGEIKLGTKKWVLVPFSTMRYSLVGFLLLLLLAVLTEFFAQRECEIGKEGFPASFCPEWKQDNLTIGKLTADRILDHNSDVMWQSTLLRLPSNFSGERKRILVIGDSFVEGDGLSNVNITWWRELQRELERRGYWNVDIVAAGRDGASTQAEAEWVEKRGIIDRFRPDAVLVGFVSNDPDVVDVNGESRIRQSHPERLDNCLPSAVTAVLQPIAPTFYERTLGQCKDRVVALREARGQEFSYWNWVVELYRPDNLTAYEPIVRKFVEEVRRKVPNLIIVPLPTNPIVELPGRPIYQDAGAIFSREGARWFDFNDKYLLRFGRQQDWKPGMFSNPANPHPGPIQTRFYAVQIADMLELEYREVLGRRGPMPATVNPEINDAVPASIELQRNGADTWSFRLLDPEKPALKWPISHEHAQISFERPVAAERLTFDSPVDIHVAVYGHFIDETDGHTEISARLIGQGSGRGVEVAMPEDLKARRLMSMRIIAEALHQEPIIEWEMPLVAAAIAKESGKAFNYNLAGIPYGGASAANPFREILTLYENERRLGPGAIAHDDIRRNGSGRYSHWGDTLYFSASDDSDPRTNGRTYRLRKLAPSPRIAMAIQFRSPAVRP